MVKVDLNPAVFASTSFRQGLHPPTLTKPGVFFASTSFRQGLHPPTLTIWSGHPNGQGLDPPNPSRLGAATQMDKGLTPPTLHDLERPKGWTPQTFTTWRAFLSRKLTADFLLPNSAYKMCHLHWAVGRSRGSPYFAKLQAKSCTPATLHDLKGAPKWTKFDPPTLHDLERLRKMDKGLTPPTLHDLERLPQMDKGLTPQPFATWSGSANGQGFGPANPSRLGGAPKWTRVGPPQPNPSRLGGCSFPGS